ncbi:hypothetical protein BCV69DRAFT_285472 [Microstroma glucosiphilum]|uniref:Zn(2)-C6 fungal-type domain-containing protein n=1 Tax=Pseudomicrostroma glucosiphilum TaxID=1684307 RepID=A0A316U0Y9_9BASI|nr:hypothetical protein BCV69DRAFT_285472 [Pseudomicrostroma glucosiphilum]PWN18171.1 hypothetical protein BCV69DRAFT_285472 [Pseudomicrostroma glucosiphilum]
MADPTSSASAPIAGPSRPSPPRSKAHAAPAQRIRTSCIPCRKRKTKCDGDKPCSSCAMRGAGGSCAYPDEMEGEGSREGGRPGMGVGETQPGAGAGAGSQGSYPVVNGSGRARRRRSSSRDSLPGPSSLSASASKRKRPTEGSEQRHLSRVPLDGPSSREDLARLVTGLQESVEDLQRAVGSHRCEPLERQTVRPHPNPLPGRCSGVLLERMVAALPPQVDCEVMLEYLLQEPDWFVVSVTAPYLLPIWSRFIYGAHLRDVEVIVLAAAISVAAVLLDEYPHNYYPTTVPPGRCVSDLMELVFSHCRTIVREERPLAVERVDLVDEMIVSGLFFDYLRFSRKSSDAWPWHREHLLRYVHMFQLMPDESSQAWQSFDGLERDLIRRVLWHTIICLRVSNLYNDGFDVLEIREENLKIRLPGFQPSEDADAPLIFTASPAGLDETSKITLKAPSRSIVRLHRGKSSEEVADSAFSFKRAVSLTAKIPSIRDYVNAFKSWQVRRLKQLRFELRKGSPAPSLDHHREALLHQALALTRDLKFWRDQWVNTRWPPVTYLEDTSDFMLLRQANKASIIHIAIAQCLSAILIPWLTEDVSNRDGGPESPLLLEVQREAYESVREIVQSIDATRALVTSGLVTYFGSFAAYAFFYAATALAVPLVGAWTLRQEPKNAMGRYGKIQLHDRYTELKLQQKKPNAGVGTERAFEDDDDQDGISLMAPSTSLVFTAEELRSMAADLIRILDILPAFRASPLSREARQRLSYLVETFGIQRRAEGMTGPPPPPSLDGQGLGTSDVPTPFTFDAFGRSLLGDNPFAVPGPGAGAPPLSSSTTTGSSSTPAWTPDNSTTTPAAMSTTTGNAAYAPPAPVAATGGEMLDALMQFDNQWWEKMLGTAGNPDQQQQQQQGAQGRAG